MASRLNRNIISDEDASNFAAATTQNREAVSANEQPTAKYPKTLGEQPPAEQRAGEPPTRDDYLTVLIKVIPIEVMALYIFLDGLVRDRAAAEDLHIWLFILMAVLVPIAGLYAWRVAGIQRLLQNILISVAMLIYIFATGGWFATTTWYLPWYGSAVLAIGVVALPIAGLKQSKALPVTDEPQG